MQWNPIETAPKDGTELMVWCPDMGVEFLAAHFTSKEYLTETYGSPDYMEEGWYPSPGYPDSWEYVVHPTHWMPLPPKPDGV